MSLAVPGITTERCEGRKTKTGHATLDTTEGTHNLIPNYTEQPHKKKKKQYTV